MLRYELTQGYFVDDEVTTRLIIGIFLTILNVRAMEPYRI